MAIFLGLPHNSKIATLSLAMTV